MSRTLARFLIGVLLALAIPFQGLAAVTAGMCTGGHYDAEAAEHAGDHHAAGGQHDSKDPSSAPHEPSGNAHCCATAAIAPAAPVALSEATSSRALQASQDYTTGFLPDKLDRPPLPL